MLNSLPFSRTTNGRAAGASHAAEPRITMSEQIKNVSDASFDADVIKSSQPVLVDYWAAWRSEEHTSELQSLMRNSYAVFCLKKKRHTNNVMTPITSLHTK